MDILEERYYNNSHGSADIEFSREEVERKLYKMSSFCYPKRWEVYRAFVAFDDYGDTFKSRPIIVIKDLGDTVLALRCTSKRYEHESYYEKYPIQKWELAGFDRPSYAILKSTIEIDKHYVYEKMGKLKSDDIDELREIFTD